MTATLVSDPTFPTLHRPPARGWINDPNGLSRIDGRYHVFFQFNPDAPVHEDIHWGHVSSADLLSWTEHPIAFGPRPDGPDRDGCWSGCVVDDGGVPTAVYTAVRGGPGDGAVVIATSDRSMLEWRQGAAPVVQAPHSATATEARDPFVFTHQGRRYAIQGAGHPVPGSIPSILLWRCDDLQSWIELPDLLTGDDPVAAAVAAADIWECPGLVQLGSDWVLVVSLWRSVNGTFALSGVSYLVGELVDAADGGLRFHPRTGGSLDEGPAFYAPQLLALPDRVLTWGWSWELDRTPEQVDAAGWAGTLTSPRELELVDGQLINRPATELTGLRQAPLSRVDEIAEPAFELVADEPISLTLRTAEREVIVINADFFAGGPSRILVDGSLVEAFSATSSYTTRAYHTGDSRWSASGGTGYSLGT
ncbi:MAG TPA: glycoside hydrolase family 32 protein [Propionibacteriaceae bacterium]|nr:glycoside hydrolase family 32 protein [Propionibacteriaceae bacterium]